ncbi:MAG: cupin domain-containing protein [Rhodospirillaceae bacterium]|nr:cupin domain-containing protein [Rhodospirillaceae bacterium]MBT3807972.1 cupin domain-containing protein [Rhodospirillaceae bacterium]MBT3929222.1 cupin domain-containing protein [Rhodospirillaceae bacterium]MBT4771469.1 cupin domain-containing protein [Rhodospirillaceae bacterium]MBT5356768.1 cupin domain-containing protein [Rhodospirillaceae bacterium]
MKTVNFTHDEMNSRVARFRDLKAQGDSHDANGNIPKEVYEAMTARTLYLLMSPEQQGGPMAQAPAVTTEDKMSVIIAECPPGNGPILHSHKITRETFLCLDGRFKIQWGDEGENELILDPYDLVAVPPRVVRRFENVSDKTARLLVIVNGDSAEDFNDIEQPQIVADELTGQFGRDAVEKLLAMGFSFNAGVDDPVI